MRVRVQENGGTLGGTEVENLNKESLMLVWGWGCMGLHGARGGWGAQTAGLHSVGAVGCWATLHHFTWRLTFGVDNGRRIKVTRPGE